MKILADFQICVSVPLIRTPTFPEKRHFLPPDTHMYVWVRKVTFFGNFFGNHSKEFNYGFTHLVRTQNFPYVCVCVSGGKKC